MKTAISTIFLLLATNSPAFAGEATVVYKSGFLVCIFVGILALIVVVQLFPAIMMVFGFIKSLVAGSGEKAPATKSVTNGD